MRFFEPKALNCVSLIQVLVHINKASGQLHVMILASGILMVHLNEQYIQTLAVEPHKHAVDRYMIISQRLILHFALCILVLTLICRQNYAFMQYGTTPDYMFYNILII